MTQKQCNNEGCERILEWNPDMPNRKGGLGAYAEVATGKRHECEFYKRGFQTRQTNDFNRNKQQWGQAYSGPTQGDQMQTEVANLVADISVMKQQILSLQQSVNGLGEAIAKVSFTTADKLEDVEPDEEIIDESTN